MSNQLDAVDGCTTSGSTNQHEMKTPQLKVFKVHRVCDELQQMNGFTCTFVSAFNRMMQKLSLMYQM